KLNECLVRGKEKDEIINYYKKIMKLYKGDFLSEETYVWKENEQEKLRILFIDTSQKMIDYLMIKKEYTEAILLSLQIQKLYPYLEYSYFTIMQLYDKLDDLYNVERQYTNLRKTLDREFNTKPNSKIRLWYQQWIENQHET